MQNRVSSSSSHRCQETLTCKDFMNTLSAPWQYYWKLLHYYFLCPCREISKHYLTLSHDHLLQWTFQFIIHWTYYQSGWQLLQVFWYDVKNCQKLPRMAFQKFLEDHTAAGLSRKFPVIKKPNILYCKFKDICHCISNSERQIQHHTLTRSCQFLSTHMFNNKQNKPCCILLETAYLV